MIPESIKKFISFGKETESCFCMAINTQLNIVKTYGNTELIGSKKPKPESSLFDVLPGVLTESFESDFEIPFYNVTSEHICNVYFIKKPELSYVVLVDKSEIFQITQKYQQFAHDDNISKNKFKRIAQELELAQKRLKKSNQEKATLIAMLSHELGTPLTSIMGYSELLLNGETDNKNALTIINRNAIYLKHLIENTLLFGQSEAGSIQIQLESIPVNTLFHELEETLLPSAKAKNLMLNVINSDGVNLNIDITRTKQILINLLNNAVKYTDEGSIELSYSKQGDSHVFSVTDTGLGVPYDLQESIFNPWERVEESSEKGSGIGLFISQQLANAIGGKLRLKSSIPAKGSTFELLIPIVKGIENKTAVDQLDYAKCIGKTLLIIDDDEDILDLIEALLIPTKFEIITATSFPKAKALLSENKVDMVLSDLNLGVVKASTFVHEIKKTQENLPIVLMTAMPSTNLKENYINKGFDDVIAKPLNKETLITTLLKYI